MILSIAYTDFEGNLYLSIHSVFTEEQPKSSQRLKELLLEDDAVYDKVMEQMLDWHKDYAEDAVEQLRNVKSFTQLRAEWLAEESHLKLAGLYFKQPEPLTAEEEI